MKKELTCINCPMGCRLTVTIEEQKVVDVKGNICPKGKQYAQQEVICPMRVVTALMPVEGEDKPLSVRTSKPIPKADIFNCVREIYSKKAKRPIVCGDVLIKDVCGTGADIIATQDIK